ncbi:MAG: hypothetical protein K9L96_03815, partial [Candidatus Omnitrophica bacterium]|nr:hypothetical protein [Candidatus Omnitrophota bacterium]
DIEKEIIYLLAIKQFIDEMVNFEILNVYGKEPDASVGFRSMTHQKFFNIILVDFLSCADTKILDEEQPYLKVLASICENPFFNRYNSIKNLSIATQNFRNWLIKEVIVEKIWLSSIDLETDLVIKRLEFIKICGNLSKHNFSRLSGVVRELRVIFERNKIMLNEEDALTIFEEFYDWFHNDIFNYHSSAIAEFLNNIRLGIHEYLWPEFKNSIVYDTNKHPKKYHYTYPERVNNSFAKKCYWDLMDEIRSKPYMPKFQVTKYLKMRY